MNDIEQQEEVPQPEEPRPQDDARPAARPARVS